MEHQSAFAFYGKKLPTDINSKKKSKHGHDKKNKLKLKFDDLCNKKKNLRNKKGLKKKAISKTGIEDWSTRRVQYNQLQNGQGQSKKYAEFEEDSRVAGRKLLLWLISPMDVDIMIKKQWEKQPFFVKRDNPEYYAKILSLSAIDKALRTEHVEYTTNVDVTSYRNGQRKTLNPAGRANAPEIWNYYNNDSCSIRFLNPHLFFPEVYSLSVNMQEYFHCMVGANVYLTPPHSQGFAPHYDDIEAFVLQIEGKKHWRVYAPRSDDEVLPRTSSQNFSQADIGEAIVDIVLEPGDLLYFPRGYIHQAKTVPGSHSLHVTLSTYQKNSWADLLEVLMKDALTEAISSDVELRKGLPLELSQHLGLIHSESKSIERSEALTHVRSLCCRILNYLPVDNAVDQMQKKFQHDALPPTLSTLERERSVRNSDLMKPNKSGQVKSMEGSVFSTNTNFRLLRANIMRLVSEDGELRLYYHMDNSKFYHEYEPTFLEIDEDIQGAVEDLIKAYPDYINAKQNVVDDEEAEVRLSVYSMLWNRGLLITKNVPVVKNK